jgi:hypothetical protein
MENGGTEDAPWGDGPSLKKKKEKEKLNYPCSSDLSHTSKNSLPN